MSHINQPKGDDDDRQAELEKIKLVDVDESFLLEIATKIEKNLHRIR
jgi:hypothetical protein